MLVVGFTALPVALQGQHVEIESQSNHISVWACHEPAPKPSDGGYFKAYKGLKNQFKSCKKAAATGEWVASRIAEFHVPEDLGWVTRIRIPRWMIKLH
jgi:hypothetical protein